VKAWVNEKYVREAFKEDGLDYDAQKKSLDNYYNINGRDPVCNKDITDAKVAAEIWVDGGDIVPVSSPVCAFKGIAQYQKAGKKIAVSYVYDQALGIKVFGNKAFYSMSGSTPARLDIVPFLLKKDAEAYAQKNGGTVVTYEQVLAKMEK
jgi:NitT/TauT family transport system substrate-binding protein